MRHTLYRIAALTTVLTISAVAMAQMQAAPTKVTVPAGTRILVRTNDPVDSSKQQAGYRFLASLETNLQADDVVVAPRGTTVHVRLANAQSAGKMSGGAGSDSGIDRHHHQRYRLSASHKYL